MSHIVKLVGESQYNWPVLLDVAHQATGERLAEEADTSPRPMTNVERILSCLHRLVTSRTKSSVKAYLQDHVSLHFLIIVDERDVDMVISEMGAMSVLVRATDSRAIFLFVSGQLSEWEYHAEGQLSALWDDIRAELRDVRPLTKVKRLT